MSGTTRPGVHSSFEISKFSVQEQRTIRTLAEHFFMTNDGREIILSRSSKYKFALVKCPDSLSESFGLYREIVVLFSLYESFETRTLDAFDRVFQMFPDLRIEKVCRLIIRARPEMN